MNPIEEDPHAISIQIPEVEGQFKVLQVGGELGMRSPAPTWEPVFNAGIVPSDDVCQLMLIRYSDPSLQMDFVSFVHLMLCAENMEGELVGRREGRGFLCTPRGLPTCPQFEQERGLLTLKKPQARKLWGMLAPCL